MGKQFREIWQSLGANQRISLILASGLVVLAMIGMMIWAARPDMQLLYGKLSAEEAGKIIAKLEQKGIKFETGTGGNSIYVESAKVHRIRMELATEGIPAGGGGPGFEIFDEGSFGISDFVQRTNFLRAVQGELARTISQFDGIESARVMVVMPENRLLSSREGQDRPTASVFVDGSGLPSSTVNSIRHLVANAIQRLNVNDVVVVDSMGTVLSEELRSDGLGGGMSSDVMKYRKSLESYFTGKVQTMLDRVLGPNQSEVRVAVDIETASVQTTQKIFEGDPVARSVVKEEDTQSESESNGDGSRTAAGITANTPNAGNAGQSFTTVKTRDDKNKTSTENYEINERVVSSVQNPGSIKRLSASLIVAKRMETVDGQLSLVDRSPEQIAELTDIVLTALGIQLVGGQVATDFVTVKEMAFAADPFVDHGAMLKEDATIQRYIEMGKNGIGAILGLGVIIFFMQMLKRYKPEKISIEVLQPDQMLQSRKMEDTSVVTPEMLNELIRQKPANIGVSLREWIGEEASKK